MRALITRRRSLGLGAIAALGATAQIWLILKGREVGVIDPVLNVAATNLNDADLARRGIARQHLGNLVVQDGRIVATDPLTQLERTAFARPVPRGSHPVWLYLAQRRIALAELRFADGTCVDWRIATLINQDAATLKPGEIFGYGVDAGLGCFMDTAGQAAFAQRDAQEEDRHEPRHYNTYDNLIAEPLRTAGDQSLLFTPLPDTPANVAIFESGWGDGFYPSYWGLDAAGQTLRLVTDFFVLNAGDGHDADAEATTDR